MGVKLWLDDLRPAPEGWVWAKNLEQAKKVFLTEEVEDASLDHDLGIDAILKQHKVFSSLEEALANRTIHETGYELVVWIYENDLWPPSLSVHSANPVGARNMSMLIDSKGPYYKKMFFERYEPDYVWGWMWVAN